LLFDEFEDSVLKYANKGEYSTLSNQRCPAREEVSGTKKEKKKKRGREGGAGGGGEREKERKEKLRLVTELVNLG
jgi:hypothetical protein